MPGINNSRFQLALIFVLVTVCAAAVAPAFAATTQSASALGNKDAGKAETAIGNLTADALRNYLHADVAFVAASELRSSDKPIAAGIVSSEAITELISYKDDPLAVLELKGSAVRQALEKAASTFPQANLGFLQVSGMTLILDPTKNAGKRISAITIGGAALDDARTYTVAVTNSMANGALGYWKVWTASNVKTRDAKATIAKAVDSFFASNPKIDYSKRDRIKTQ